MATTDSVHIEASRNDRPPFPSRTENPQLLWAFIRKVYGKLAIQLLSILAISVTVIFLDAIPEFMHTKPGIIVYIFTHISSLIILFPLHTHQKHHPVNLLLLMLFTIDFAFAVGLSSSYSIIIGIVILQYGILTSAVIVTLTLYALWAEKKSYNFCLQGPFVIASLLLLIVFPLVQLFIPLRNLTPTAAIIGGLGATAFSSSIIYDTKSMINRFKSDEYIWAAISLYPGIINRFLDMFKAHKDNSAEEGGLSDRAVNADVEEEREFGQGTV